MDRNQIKLLFENIRIWQRGDERASHKPLLLLYVLGRFQREQTRYVDYEDVKRDLGLLLDEFGPPRKTRTIYPFLRLCNDGIWKLKNWDNTEAYDPSESDLLKCEVAGGFTEEVYSQLKADAMLVCQLAQHLLSTHFPDTMHEDILNAIGLEINITKKSRRDPKFREQVLRAYEYSCAICGFQVWLRNTLVGVDAAHIKWHQANGPDIGSNGLALCSMHHKLFDRGAFSLVDGDKAFTICVAEEAHGKQGFNEWLLNYNGKQIRNPVNPIYTPRGVFTKWHLREVFRGPHRYIVD